MSFPNVADAFWDWTNGITFKLVTTTVADFEVTETPVQDVSFDGVLEPTPPQKLLVKPEGQRSWKWYTLWTTFNLKDGQIVQDEQNKQYRVMSRGDWRNGGHQQYELVQDPPLGS